MRRRHPPIPRLWLMTDSRMGEDLWAALDRLPCGSGIVFRHYELPAGERRTLFAKVARIARRKRLSLVRAGAPVGRGETGVHGRRGRGLITRSAHNRREAIAAVRQGAHVVFASPVFATRSHPGAKALGKLRFRLMVQGLDAAVIALGGMNRLRARGLGVHGWAGIDAWL